ncbi:hypothetical protein NTE_03432 [Candidatus Nitrososphaera evergladensis SR1]|uniref:Uncharacterized protein n=1 Tax=Candidatus Nitrososphaera evergladensis SR1 TaxID=1459636 RepID=A0A075MW30_9ARCH|nr:hypothetical protein NTE_03432 [Candidatus Nitrososphaera evergladensis SR1]
MLAGINSSQCLRKKAYCLEDDRNLVRIHFGLVLASSEVRLTLGKKYDISITRGVNIEWQAEHMVMLTCHRLEKDVNIRRFGLTKVE